MVPVLCGRIAPFSETNGEEVWIIERVAAGY